MKCEAFLAFTGVLQCSGLGVGAVARGPHTLVPWAFALGMLVLALREMLVVLGAQCTTLAPASWCCPLLAKAMERISPRAPGSIM